MTWKPDSTNEWLCFGFLVGIAIGVILMVFVAITAKPFVCTGTKVLYPNGQLKTCIIGPLNENVLDRL